MKSSSLVIAGALAVAGVVGCGSDTTETPSGGTNTTTTTTGQGGAGGAGGDMTSSTTSAGGAGGMGQGGGTGGGGGAMVCPGLNDPCSDCLADQCQESYCACYNNPECTALGMCLYGCDQNDPNYEQCTQDCAAQHPQGVADAAVVGSCSDQNCQPECPPTGIMLDPCQECLLTECNDEMDACFANPECQAIIECGQMCAPGDQACQQDCAAMHPGGLAQAGAVLSCGQTNCSMQCQ